MRRFVCWDPKTVPETIVDDAPRNTAAVFAAVHRPMRILRKTVRTRHEEIGTIVAESDVLDDLLGDDDQDRIIPITGESGTGKSHLIRWLANHITPDPRRHVVYIEKRGTSLRRVIEKILEGLDSEGTPNAARFRELQTQVADAITGIDREHAPQRLLGLLALAIRESGDEAPSGASNDEIADREDLAERLPDLISDPEFRVPLLAVGGIIDITVRQALEGGNRLDRGEPPAFTLADLHFNAVDATRAAGVAQDLRSDLFADDGLRRLAVTMMNEALPRAVREMIGLKSGDLYQIFLQVREALQEADKRLVLLVEDLALLRGVETELVDAMIETPDPDGTRTLCVIRSAVAVTTGYFDSLRTALTRIDHRGPLYNLDMEIGANVSNQEVRAFVAGYLNAARWGRQELEDQFEQASPVDRASGRWLRSYCSSKCPHTEQCHAGFRAEDQYGLYPFNPQALQRVIESQMRAFDPRLIITVLTRTLTSVADQIRAGTYPSVEWAESYNQQRVVGERELRYMPPSVQDDLASADPVDHQRRETLLTFWGGTPDHIVNLHGAIHDAFALDALPGVETLIPDVDGDEAAVTPPRTRLNRPVTVRPADERQQDDPLTLWANGQRLEQRLATDLRRALRDHVYGARDWAALGIAEDHVDAVLVPEHFVIRPSAGGRNPSDPIATLEASAANAVLLDAVRTAKEQRDWSFDRGEERLIELAHQVDEWAEIAQQRMLARQRGEAGDLNRALAESLLLSGALGGTLSPGDSPPNLVAGALHTVPVRSVGPDWPIWRRNAVEGPANAARRSDLQARLLDHVALRRALDAANTVAIDPIPILQAIEALAGRHWRTADTQTLEALGNTFVNFARTINRIVERDLPGHIEQLAEQRNAVLKALGGANARTTAKSFQELDQAARDVGVGARRAAVKRNDILARFREVDLKAIAARVELEDPAGLDANEKLAHANSDVAARIADGAEFVEWATTMLDEIEEAVRQRTFGDYAPEEVGVAHMALIEVLDRFADAVADE